MSDDVFTKLGESARVNFTPPRKATSKAEAQQTAAEKGIAKALAQRDKQFELYEILKRAERQRHYAEPVHGDRLRKFGATLNHFGIEDGDRMTAYVAAEARAWLRAAPHDVRFVGGELISERIQRIRLKAKLAVFNDPIFDEEPDVRMICRGGLGL